MGFARQTSSKRSKKLPILLLTFARLLTSPRYRAFFYGFDTRNLGPLFNAAGLATKQASTIFQLALPELLSLSELLQKPASLPRLRWYAYSVYVAR